MSENAAHPFLPSSPVTLNWRDLHGFGENRGPDFYHTCLCMARQLFEESLPERALLALDRAFLNATDPDWPILIQWPIPYLPMVKIFKGTPHSLWFGNPVRHFHHLALRVREPHQLLKQSRASLAFHLAKKAFPAMNHDPLLPPPIPLNQALQNLVNLAWNRELSTFYKAYTSPLLEMI